jgi:hypothetical protein
MHVSVTMRREAEKHFWFKSDACYRVTGEWVLSGGYTGHTNHDVEFLASVLYVEVEFYAVPFMYAD